MVVAFFFFLFFLRFLVYTSNSTLQNACTQSYFILFTRSIIDTFLHTTNSLYELEHCIYLLLPMFITYKDKIDEDGNNKTNQTIYTYNEKCDC